jgi:cellulose synthase/poly-beta-1,6-N-acetylglucosamine synthase-like glycosyltransferase
MVEIAVELVGLLLFLYFAASVCYLLIFALAGKFLYKDKVFIYSQEIKKIAVLVPAYKEDEIILSTVQNLRGLDYPSEAYSVYVLADSFQPGTLIELSKLVNLFEVRFEKSTKAKSLNEGFRNIDRHYDIAVIVDADNLLERNFLKKINAAFISGAKAVQGRRVAKNIDSPFAILDACSEAINNNIFRKGANALGLSTPIIGSGMAFDYNLVQKVLTKIDAVGGFDKPLQLKIVENGYKIEYLDKAIIFDEKVDSSASFQQQRRRWLSSQLIYLKKFFIPGIKQLAKGNVSYFNLAVLNGLILPRAFLFISLPALIIICVLVNKDWAVLFSVLFFLYLLTLAISLPKYLVKKDLLQAMVYFPRALGNMVSTLFHIKKANKTFIHTKHSKTKVTNTLFEDQL